MQAYTTSFSDKDILDKFFVQPIDNYYEECFPFSCLKMNRKVPDFMPSKFNLIKNVEDYEDDDCMSIGSVETESDSRNSSTKSISSFVKDIKPKRKFGEVLEKSYEGNICELREKLLKDFMEKIPKKAQNGQSTDKSSILNKLTDNINSRILLKIQPNPFFKCL